MGLDRLRRQVRYAFFGYLKNDVKLSNENEIIATYKGNTYNLTDWSPQHPGGRAFIEGANGKDLEELWEARGLQWHMNEQWIMDILENSL